MGWRQTPGACMHGGWIMYGGYMHGVSAIAMMIIPHTPCRPVRWGVHAVLLSARRQPASESQQGSD